MLFYGYIWVKINKKMLHSEKLEIFARKILKKNKNKLHASPLDHLILIFRTTKELELTKKKKFKGEPSRIWMTPLDLDKTNAQQKKLREELKESKKKSTI